MSSSIVRGIGALVGTITHDVTSRVIDDASDTIDATELVQRVRPIPGPYAERADDTTFYGVGGGREVVFEVTFVNDSVPPLDTVQIIRAAIELHEPGSAETLDTRQVYIVVPQGDGGLI